MIKNVGNRIYSFLPGFVKSDPLSPEELIIKKDFAERLTYFGYPGKLKIHNFLTHVVPKICDFGWSVHTHRQRNTMCGTLYYMAPEIISNWRYSSEVDIWAVGILAYELCSGRLPFDGKNDKVIMERIRKKRYPAPEGISFHAEHFIKSIIDTNCEKRPSLVKLMNHRWMKEITKKREKRVEAFLELEHKRSSKRQEA